MSCYFQTPPVTDDDSDSYASKRRPRLLAGNVSLDDNSPAGFQIQNINEVPLPFGQCLCFGLHEL